MTKVNFLPDDYIEKKAQRRTNIICLILFVLVTAGLGTGFLVLEQRKDRLALRMEQTHMEMIKAGESLKQLEILEQKKKQMTQKASISALLMEPVPRSLLLATVTNALPGGVSLVDCKLNTKEQTTVRGSVSRNKQSRRSKKKTTNENQPPALPKYETDIEISGIAPTDFEVSALMEELNKSGLFSQVNLSSSEEHKLQDDEVLRYFKLALTLDPKARASEEDVRFAREHHVRGM